MDWYKKVIISDIEMDPADFNDVPVPPVFSAPVPPVLPDTDVEVAEGDIDNTQFVTDLVSSQVRGWMVCINYYFIQK